MATDSGVNVILAVVEHALVEAKQLRDESTALRQRADDYDRRAMVLEELHAIAAPMAPERAKLAVA